MPLTDAAGQHSTRHSLPHMKIAITYATPAHLAWLKARDRHISEAALKKKILDQEIIIIESESGPLGWLRFGFFWDSIPFMNMLCVEEARRGEGIGKRLVQFWERDMRAKNHELVMTSSQSDEDAQHFYRKLGYVDAGSFTLPGEPVELLFIKTFP